MPGDAGSNGALGFEHAKELHVSPFVDLDATYRYRIDARPGDRVAIAIEVVDRDGTVLRTSASGTRRRPRRRPPGATPPPSRHTGSWAPSTVTPSASGATAPRSATSPRTAGVGSLPADSRCRPPKDPPCRPASLPHRPPADRAARCVAAGRRLTLAALRSLPRGRLTLVLPDGARHRFGTDDGTDEVELRVLDDRFFARLVTRRRLAVGEGWTAGEWTTDDLPTCLALLHGAAEHHRTTGVTGRLGALHERRPRLRRPRVHRPDLARDDIAYHYDLGNDLYERFLDPTMAYSSAWFTDPDQSLEDAQLTKFEKLCERLELTADDHLLEIGCGWGGFAVHAAATRGCRVDAVTLSHQQAVAARARVAEAGLADRVRVIESDYRSLTGTYDKIASVEMIEAVGHDLDTFFATCDRLLAPDGTVAVQAIAKPDQRARRVRNLDDGWVERYIFPGSLIPDLTGLTAAATAASELVLAGADEFGGSYARTLAEWRRRFHAARDELADLGYDDEFARAWDFYLATAEAGFRVGYLRVFHLSFRRIGPPPAVVATSAADVTREAVG